MKLLEYILHIMINSILFDGDAITVGETFLSIGILLAVTFIFLASLKIFSEFTNIKPWLYVVISALLALLLPAAVILIIGVFL